MLGLLPRHGCELGRHGYQLLVVQGALGPQHPHGLLEVVGVVRHRYAARADIVSGKVKVIDYMAANACK